MTMNKLILIGNLTRDPDLRSLPGGAEVANVGIAVNKRWKDKSGQPQEKASFYDLSFWDRQAQVAGQYLRKGSKIYIEGEPELETFEKRDGTFGAKIKVRVFQLEMLSGKQDDAPANAAPNTREPIAPPAGKQTLVDAPEPATADAFDDDIPF
jgi:single-strand DNA-binding protein